MGSRRRCSAPTLDGFGKRPPAPINPVARTIRARAERNPPKVSQDGAERRSGRGGGGSGGAPKIHLTCGLFLYPTGRFLSRFQWSMNAIRNEHAQDDRFPDLAPPP